MDRFVASRPDLDATDREMLLGWRDPVEGIFEIRGYDGDAIIIAQVALKVATRQPGLVFRNPEKVERGWQQMREDRAEFVEFFGGDEVVLPPGEARLAELVLDG